MDYRVACDQIDRFNIRSFSSLPKALQFEVTQYWLTARKLRLILDRINDLAKWQQIADDESVAVEYSLHALADSMGNKLSNPQFVKDACKKVLGSVPAYNFPRPEILESIKDFILACANCLRAIEVAPRSNKVFNDLLNHYVHSTERTGEMVLGILAPARYSGEATPDERDQILRLKVRTARLLSQILVDVSSQLPGYQSAVDQLKALEHSIENRPPRAMRMAREKGWIP